MSVVKKTQRKTGPVPWSPDPKEIERLSRLHCTDAEIGAFFGVTVRTVEREKVKNPAFADAIEIGRNFGKHSLRRKQVEIAETGNPQLLIWLGKQYLNHRDKSDIEQSVEYKEIDKPSFGDRE